MRQLGPVTDREEREQRQSNQQQPPQQQQQQQQRQAGYKRPFYAPVGPGAAVQPQAAAAGGQHGPPQRQQQQQRQGASPHVGKSSFNPALSPAEVARRRAANRCFHCNAPCGRLENHAPDCKFRREREAAAKRKASA